MWIWRADFDRLVTNLRQAEVDAARLEAENKMLRENAALINHSLELAHNRNQSIFDALMQIKYQHPGTGYQDALKQMFQDGEVIGEEDPDELQRYHEKMQSYVDQGLDPGLILLEDMDELRDEPGSGSS